MTGHRDKDLIMAFAVEAQTSETPWDIFQFKGRTRDIWNVCAVEPVWGSEVIEYRLKPKTKVIDWSKVNYDIVPVSYTHKNSPAKYVSHHRCEHGYTLVTGKRIAWTGGECPLPEGVIVDYGLRDSEVVCNVSCRNLYWGGTDADGDIIWFRVTGLADGYSWGEV
tara:strand:+ start:1104 stop:1598 length:495 start_codon:yes stop_codon:yes gene_type:complete